MDYYLKFAVVLLLMLAVRGSAGAQEPQQQDVPAVTTAVAPNFPLIALHSHTSGETVIEVKINSEGAVTSAEAVSGSQVFVGSSRQIARRWKFAPKDKSRIRTARLTFVYRLAPRGTPADELLPIFKPPYRVEVTQVLPDERPLP
jgi:outer membrane biosynthesis protein TonB